jgi:hypothetical protein
LSEDVKPDPPALVSAVAPGRLLQDDETGVHPAREGVDVGQVRVRRRDARPAHGAEHVAAPCLEGGHVRRALGRALPLHDLGGVVAARTVERFVAREGA